MKRIQVLQTVIFEALLAFAASFLCFDIVVLRCMPIEKSIGGEIDLALVLACTFLSGLLVHVSAALISPRMTMQKFFSSGLVHVVGLILMWGMITFGFEKLSGYRQSTVVLQILYAAFLWAAPFLPFSKFKWLSIVGIAAFYWMTFGLLPTHFSRQIGVVSGDWIVLRKLGEVRYKYYCWKVLEDADFFDEVPCDWTCQNSMVPITLRYYPEAVAHFDSCEIMTSYSINWHYYD